MKPSLARLVHTRLCWKFHADPCTGNGLWQCQLLFYSEDGPSPILESDAIVATVIVRDDANFPRWCKLSAMVHIPTECDSAENHGRQQCASSLLVAQCTSSLLAAQCSCSLLYILYLNKMCENISKESPELLFVLSQSFVTALGLLYAFSRRAKRRTLLTR